MVPDESSILRFRHLLEAHQLTAVLFVDIRNLLIEKRLLVQTGTIVDATRSGGSDIFRTASTSAHCTRDALRS